MCALPGIAILLLCGAAFAQSSGTTPKPKPEGYPAHARSEEGAVAAEYLVHTLPAGARSFVVPGYLIVEVALYPPRSRVLDVAASRFTLRINGKKRELRAETPTMVAYTVRYRDQDRRRGLQVGAGPVILGRPPRAERFPGDPTADREAPPVQQPLPGGVERQPEETAIEAIERTALPEGPVEGPVSGYVFFAYKGKTKAIESLDLVFHGDAATVVRLF